MGRLARLAERIACRLGRRARKIHDRRFSQRPKYARSNHCTSRSENTENPPPTTAYGSPDTAAREGAYCWFTAEQLSTGSLRKFRRAPEGVAAGWTVRMAQAAAAAAASSSHR